MANNGSKRWLFGLLGCLIAVVIYMTRCGNSDGDEPIAGDGTSGGAKDPSTAVSGGDTPERGGSTRSGTIRDAAMPPIAKGALRLEGIVVDADQKPATGARVTIGEGRTVVTETDGGFAFDALAEGDYTVRAEQGEWFAEVQEVTLDDTSEPVTVQLARGPTLVVKVIDGAGKPIANAKVEIVSRKATTGADGVVRFRGVAIDDELVYVTAAGYANIRERVETSDDHHKTIEKVIAMRNGANVAGIVVDKDGKRVGDAYVELEPAGGGRSETTWSDENGAWTLPDIGGGGYVARASSKEAIALADVMLDLDGKTPKQGVVLRVEPGGEIEGLVTDTAGHPVPDARVSGGSVGETTDEQGRFLAKGLMPDKYALSVSTPQLGAIDTVVELKRGEHAKVKIVVVPSSLAGTVVDSRGQPVEGASVSARSESPEGYGYDRTDEYGHFDLGGLPPGTYKITATREDSSIESKPIEAKTGNRQVRLVVLDEAMIVGRVVAGGSPVTYFGYAVSDDPTDVYSRPRPVRDDDGQFTIKDAEPGTFAVILVGPGFARKVVPDVRVVAGRVTDLGDISVERGEVLHGRVVDERGVAVAGAAVKLMGSRWEDGTLRSFMSGNPFTETDVNGYYEIAGLPPSEDDRTIEATHPTQKISTLRVLKPKELVVDLTLVRSGSIDGTIIRARRDMDMIVASLTDDSNIRYTATADAFGRFQFPQLTPGMYDVEVIGSNTLPTLKVEVRGGATARAEFEVSGAPVELRVHAPGCDMPILRDPGTQEMLMMERCENGVSSFKDVSPGSYLLCFERDDCMPVQVPQVPVFDVRH